MIVIQPDMHDDGRALLLHGRIVEGFTVAEAERQLIAVGLSPDELPRLIQRDARTLKTKAARRKRLGRRDTAELVEVVRLRQYAAQVLGRVEYVDEWFAEPHPALGGRTPANVAGDAYGRSLVTDILGRIEHGVYG